MPLIHQLNELVKQLRYADDSVGEDTLTHLCDLLVEIGPQMVILLMLPKHIYFVKTIFNNAIDIFKNTNISVKSQGQIKTSLGRKIINFFENYVKDKMVKCTHEIETPSKFALNPPNAAYTAYIHMVLIINGHELNLSPK